mgnify:CR=1 FL=1
MKKGIKEENILKRVSNDFNYALKAKTGATIYLDANKAEPTTNLATDTYLKLLEDFYNGFQWKTDKEGNAIDITKRIVKPTLNFIKTIVDERVDIFRKRKITIDAHPTTPDIDLAIAIRQLMNYIWKKRKINIKLAEAYRDALVYGVGFFKIVWNDIVQDIDVVPISPFDVYPDPYGLEIDQMRYLHIRYRKPREWVEQQFQTKLIKKEKDEEEKATDPNEDIEIFESWYSPFVFGSPYCVIWTENQILSIKDVNEITGSDRFPIFSFKTKRKSNSFWGQSLVYNLIDLQILQNKTLGFILDSMLIANNGRIYTTDPNVQLTDDPTELITLTQGEQIGVLSLNAIDPRWFPLLNYTGYNMAQSLSATYAVNTGGQTNQTTATGLVAQQNAGNTGVEADIFELTYDINDFGQVFINMIKKLYKKSDFQKIFSTSMKTNQMDVDSLIQQIQDSEFEVYFDLSDPLPDDKLSRNNLFAGLLAQRVIDLPTYAKLTNNVELINILNEQNSGGLQQLMQAMQGAQGAPSQSAAQSAGQGEAQGANAQSAEASINPAATGQGI